MDRLDEEKSRDRQGIRIIISSEEQNDNEEQTGSDFRHEGRSVSNQHSKNPFDDEYQSNFADSFEVDLEQNRSVNSNRKSYTESHSNSFKNDNNTTQNFVPFHFVRPKSPVAETSYIDEAAKENFDDLKESLNYALGSSNANANWFPVHGESTKSEVSDEEIVEEFSNNNAYLNEYTDNILLDDLNSSTKNKSVVTEPFRLNLPAQYGANHLHSQQPEISLNTPGSSIYKTSSRLGDITEEVIESGTHLSVHSKPRLRLDIPSSPAKFTDVITRLSDRIAGENPTTPLTATESPSKLNRNTGSTQQDAIFSDELSAKSENLAFNSTFPDVNSINTNTGSSAIIDNTLVEVESADEDLNRNNSLNREMTSATGVLSSGLGLFMQNSNKSSNTIGSDEQVTSQTSANKPSVREYHGITSSKPLKNLMSQDSIYLFGNSLKVFSPKSKVRKLCHNLISRHRFNLFLLYLLILQIALLTYRQWNPYKLHGYFYHGYNWADYILIAINFVYTIEILGKIIAYGLYDDHSMFRDLGISYPRHNIDIKWFSLTYIIGVVRSFASKLPFAKHKNVYKVKYKSFGGINDQKDDEDNDLNNNVLNDPDVKEINLNETENSRYQIFDPDNVNDLDLGSKYSDLKSHHDDVSVRNTRSVNENDIELSDAKVSKSQAFDAKNTLLLSSSKKLDDLEIKRAYLMYSWNRIDFISMVAFWISLLLSIDNYDAKHQIMLFRAISCLRILRFCNLTTGTSTILTACRSALPQLIDVSLFICCFWLFFGIIGVQSFKSSLTRQCVWTNPNDSNETYVNEGQYCGSYIGLDGNAMPYLTREGTSSGVIKGFRCPMYSKCISGDNPYGGTVSFDNILQSLEMVFVVMSANTFTDIMYYTTDSDNLGACLFFIFCIFILTVWLINVFIAVIVASFNLTRKEVAEEEKKRKEDRRIFNIFGSSKEDSVKRNGQINLMKKQNYFYNIYDKLEFVFVILIAIDLFIQCFREYNMSSLRSEFLYRVEAAFTAVFLVEIIIRFLVHLPAWRLFFSSRRNIFDLVLAVITSIIIIPPIKERLGHAYYWLTAFQIMRFYRVVLATGVTRSLWLKIMSNFKSFFDLTLFFFILIFLVSIILSRYFEGAIPREDLDDVDFPLHTLPNTFIALYVITSTENWSDILYAFQQYATTTSYRSFGAIFLIGWFIISNMMILNVFVAVTAKTLEISEEQKRKQQLLQFINNMTERLQNLENESRFLSKFKNKVFKKKGVNENLEKAVVNLLLSGTAVNDFLDDEQSLDESTDNEKIRTLPSSSWKSWFQVNFWRTNDFFTNPFYEHSKKNSNKKLKLGEFNPADFAKSILTERNVLISKQNKFLKKNPRFNNVFYVMGPRHKLRRFCQRLVEPSYGERIDGVLPKKIVSETFIVIMFLASIGLVITACYLTPLYRKRLSELYGSKNWSLYIEMAFVVLFTLEFLIKIFADGLIFTPNAYMRSTWNDIDLMVLITLWIELIAFLKNDGALSRIVRGLKALRALRLLTISETAKSNFHNTIFSGFWKIVNAAIISLCLLFPFSIWGLNVFNGRLGYCLDGYSDLADCFNEYSASVFNWDVVSPNIYTNPYLEFDKFTTSFSSLFEIVSLEGWVDLLLNVMSSTGVGTPPENYATPINGLLIVIFNFTSIVFILTLFVSVIINNYSQTTGRAYMTDEQISWYHVKKFLSQIQPSKRRDFKKLGLFKRFCYKMVVEKNVIWTSVLSIVLAFHVLALLLECFPSYEAIDTFRSVIFVTASLMFSINSIMMLFAMGIKTLLKYKYLFNFAISLGAFITTLIGFKVTSSSVFFNINKLFLVGMLFFIIPRSNRLSQLLKFASASLPSLISLSFTWIVIFLVFAIAMNQIFGMTKVGPNGTGNLNLRSVPKSLIVLFRCSFGEGWNYIMDDYTLEPPFCTSGSSVDDSDCGSKEYSYILFVLWNIISMYIFLNMFVSLILDSFSYINYSSSAGNFLKREEVRKFKSTWQKFDPEGTGFIDPQDLSKLLHSLDGAFSFHFYSGSLEIPELCRKWIKRNNIHDPYDITINYDKIDETLKSMDIPKIRMRRKTFERFIEEAMLTMELNNDPGISFVRLLLQLPLYISFEAGQCLNLIDFLERRLLMKKVEKRLYIKRVHETIAAYACRWKYKQNQRNGIRDSNIDFGGDVRRSGYLINSSRDERTPSIFVTDTYNASEDSVNLEDIESKRSNSIQVDIDVESGDVNSVTSGIYVPKSPLNTYKSKNNATFSNASNSERPNLFLQIHNKSKPSIPRESPLRMDFSLSPFADSESISDKSSYVDILTFGETIEDSSWHDALKEVQIEKQNSQESE